MTHWKRSWCWERLKAGEGDDRGWDDWMASPTRWTWVWANSSSWWWTGKRSVLQSMGLQSWTWRRDWTELPAQSALHFPPPLGMCYWHKLKSPRMQCTYKFPAPFPGLMAYVSMMVRRWDWGASYPMWGACLVWISYWHYGRSPQASH